MGKSNSYVLPFYKNIIKTVGDVALLGFADNNVFEGDLYDLSLGNWEINSDWTLPKKYDTIISTRCPYFAKDPELFIKKVYDHLNNDGVAYLDWGLGDHWRFNKYKIGWVKDGEHEYAYSEDNYLWSLLWSYSYSKEKEAVAFLNNCKKFGYDDLNTAIESEVPKTLDPSELTYWQNIEFNMLTLWQDLPQLYILYKLSK
tara:strand:- start:106 stop:705 length:600 start_codon:yes stop_codon:yes gene_type:complete